MIDAQRVLAQVQQRQYPADWQVFRGKRRSPIVVAFVAIFYTLFFIVFFSILAVVITGFLHVQAGSTADPFTSVANRLPISLKEAAIGAGGLALAVGIIAALFAARDAGDPDPLLIVLPQGFVEYISHRKPIQSFAFAEISNLALRVGTRRYSSTSYNAATGLSTTTYRTMVHFWLDLYYRDGRKGKWKQRVKFGAPEAMCQVIIAAHAQYVALARQYRAR